MGLFKQFTKDEAVVLKKVAAESRKKKKGDGLAGLLAEELKPESTEAKRDYKKEAGWEAAKYKQFNVKVEKEKGEAFAVALKRNNDSLISWFTRCMDTYLQDDGSVNQ